MANLNEGYIERVKDWAISKHAETNHMYADIYPYALHLNWVASAGRRFIHLVPNKKIYVLPFADTNLQTLCIATCYTHDCIEDARQSYNDIKRATASFDIAEATLMLTNNRGRNRTEKADDNYYEGIRGNEIARFVKLCDRIGNMEFGKYMGGHMYNKYKEELPEFLEKTEADIHYPEMADYLRSL